MKRRKILDLLGQLADSVRRGVPHDLHFKPTGKLTEAEVKKLQSALDRSFETWRNTWLLPVIERIEGLVREGSKL